MFFPNKNLLRPLKELSFPLLLFQTPQALAELRSMRSMLHEVLEVVGEFVDLVVDSMLMLGTSSIVSMLFNLQVLSFHPVGSK